MLKRILLCVALGLLLASRVSAAPAHEAAAPDVHAAAPEHGTDAHEKPAPLVPNPTDAETWWQALWVVIIFVVLLIILYKTAWQNVLTGLKKREKKIRDDITEAEETRKNAEKTLGEYKAQLATAEQMVRDMIAKAIADGERVAAGLRTAAQQEADETKQRSLREIESAKNQAVSEIYEQAATLATNVAEKILKRNLNANDQRDLVAQSLEQLQIIGKR